MKTANKQYSKLNNDYEMTFTNETVIEQCDEADNLPHIVLNIVPLSQLSDKSANENVDIIGVVKSAGDLSTIVTKAQNKELSKRDINIVDDSSCSIRCTLWGKQVFLFDYDIHEIEKCFVKVFLFDKAEDFHIEELGENPVVLLKGARLGDYGGRSVSVGGNTVFQINPDIPEAHKLRGWFDQGGNQSEVRDLSSGTVGGSGGAGLGQANWKTFDLLKDEQLGMGDKADYFSSKATVLYIRKDNSMYMACPGEGCNKKVIDQNDGSYRCEKCNRSYNEFKWRIILSVSL